jgi:Fatty acid desaturase
MVIKTVFMLSLYFVPIIMVSTGLLTQTWQLFAAFILSGFGMAGIGMGIMHDAIHGTYSSNPKINKILSYTLNMVGQMLAFGVFNTMYSIIALPISMKATMISMLRFSCASHLT